VQARFTGIQQECEHVVSGLQGLLSVEFRDRSIELGLREGLALLRDLEPSTETEVIVFEPAATRNTGDVVRTTSRHPTA
jgi:hypothetical protein